MGLTIKDAHATVLMLVTDFNTKISKLRMDSYLQINPMASIRLLTEALLPTQMRAKLVTKKDDVTNWARIYSDHNACADHCGTD